MADNPVAREPFYREYAIRAIPGLAKLDEYNITNEERRQVSQLNLEEMISRTRQHRSVAQAQEPISLPKCDGQQASGERLDAMPDRKNDGSVDARVQPNASPQKDRTMTLEVIAKAVDRSFLANVADQTCAPLNANKGNWIEQRAQGQSLNRIGLKVNIKTTSQEQGNDNSQGAESPKPVDSQRKAKSTNNL